MVYVRERFNAAKPPVPQDAPSWFRQFAQWTYQQLQSVQRGIAHPNRVDLRDFGNVGAGNDDSPAIINAHAQAKDAGYTLFFPRRIYHYDSALTFARLHVEFEYGARLKPSSSCPTPCLTIDPYDNGTGNDFGYPLPMVVAGLRMDGSDTSGKGGCLVVPGSTPSGKVAMRDFLINGFDDAGGYGLQVKDAVECEFTNGVCTANYENLILDSTAGDTPTTLAFRRFCSNAGTSTTTGGIVVKGGWGIDFDGLVCQSNASRGLYITSKAGNTVRGLTVRGRSWFENNWLGDASRASKYALEVDGSGVSQNIDQVHIKDSNFDDATKSIRLVNARNYRLDDNLYSLVSAGAVLIDDGSIGTISDDLRSYATNADYVNCFAFNGTGKRVPKEYVGRYTDSTASATDADRTFVFGTDPERIILNVPIAADRTWTLAEGSAAEGAVFRITRTAASTGAFAISVQRADTTVLQTLAAGTWAEFTRLASNWFLTASGSL